MKYRERCGQVIELPVPFTSRGPTPRQSAINAFLGLADRLPPAAFGALRKASYELLLRVEGDELATYAFAVLFDEISESLDRTESRKQTPPLSPTTP